LNFLRQSKNNQLIIQHIFSSVDTPNCRLFELEKFRSKDCALRYGGPPIFQGRERVRKKTTDGDFKMLTKTKIALAAALIVGTASAALAGDKDDDRGGFVMPGSMDGVNPVYHPDLFPGYAAREADTATGGQAYGYVATPKPTHRAPQVRTQDR
jgi:hypothetical protein